MQSLSAQEILHVWETGLHQHGIERALLVIETAYPGVTRDELATLSVGQRDRRLLEVRAATFGTVLNATTRCPACQEQLEFSYTTMDFSVPSEESGKLYYQMSIADYQITFRTPNSFDLAAIVPYRNANAAYHLLIERCIARVEYSSGEVSLANVPESVIAALIEQMSERDSQAEILIALNCPVCGQNWSQIFDIGAFFWIELSAHARRLLHSVHTLARVYGWSESEILNLSSARRALYMEMV